MNECLSSMLGKHLLHTLLVFPITQCDILAIIDHLQTLIPDKRLLLMRLSPAPLPESSVVGPLPGSAVPTHTLGHGVHSRHVRSAGSSHWGNG